MSVTELSRGHYDLLRRLHNAGAVAWVALDRADLDTAVELKAVGLVRELRRPGDEAPYALVLTGDGLRQAMSA